MHKVQDEANLNLVIFRSKQENREILHSVYNIENNPLLYKGKFCFSEHWRDSAVLRNLWHRSSNKYIQSRVISSYLSILLMWSLEEKNHKVFSFWFYLLTCKMPKYQIKKLKLCGMRGWVIGGQCVSYTHRLMCFLRW